MEVSWLFVIIAVLGGLTVFLVLERFKAEIKMDVLLASAALQQENLRLLTQGLVDSDTLEIVQLPGPVYVPTNSISSITLAQELQKIGQTMQKSGSSNTDSPTDKS